MSSGNVFAAQPSATTDAATSIASTTAVLNGTVNAGNESTTVTFEYGLDTGYGLTMTAGQSPVTGSSDTAVSAAIGELLPNTTYHFRVVAVNGSGTASGRDMTFTTLHAAPSVLTTDATGVGADTATLNGNANPNGANTTITFQYGTDTSYGTTVTADQSPQSGDTTVACSADISGLSGGTTYHYRIVGVNEGGTTYGNDMTFTTAGAGSGAPTATTDAANGIGTSGATLNGTVNASNADTTVTFEYGTDTSYGETVTADQSPVTGSSDTAVSRTVADLLPNTEYHYRVVGVNQNGTDNGADMTFTTLPEAPSATTGAASDIQVNGATLNGTVNANGATTTVTFQYGLNTAYGSTVTADQSPVTGLTDTSVSAAISGLQSNTVYHYRVVAASAGGTTYGDDATFQVGTAPPEAATDPASAVNTDSATLNGTVNANNASTDVTFEFGTTMAYGRTFTATPSTLSGGTDTAVAYDISGLDPNTTYHYRVVAQNASGTAYGDNITFTTLAAPTVTTDAATGVDADEATLNGTVNANGDSSTITFEYGLTTAYGTTVTATQSPVTGSSDTAVSRSISGLANATTYHYRVVGTNANGTSYGEDRTFLTGDPAAPDVTTDAATFVLTDGATLNGTVDANNASTTVTFEYGTTVAYGTTVTADQSPVSGNTGTAVSTSVTGLANSTTYHYRVVGTNANGTDNGADQTFTTSSAPSAVTDPASGIGALSATLNGTVNANSGTVTSLYFEYGLTVAYGSITGTDQSATGNTNTPVTATISGLTENTTYHYRIVIVTNNGAATGTDMTFTTTAAPTATTDAASGIGATGATLNGTVNAAGESTTVTFEYGEDTNYGSMVTADQSPVAGSSDTAVDYSVTELRPNTTYHYRVAAQNVNATVYGADETFTTDPAPPLAQTDPASGITSAGAVMNGTVNAYGQSTTVTFEYGTTVAYGNTATADESPVTGSLNNGVSYTLSGLSNNTTYHYRVVAQNATGTTNGTDRTFTTGATAPGAITNAATNVGDNSATLNGSVNANDADTTVTFEYGTDTAYGRSTPAVPDVVTGNTYAAVSLDLSGLENSTTYHYRVVAQNGAGTTYGDDRTFSTFSDAPVIPTLSEYGTMLLILLIAAAGVFMIRRNSAGRPEGGMA